MSLKTLVVPCVLIGNIPQLAVDLLICNFEFKRVKALDDEYLYPFFSPMDSNDENQYTTALELYHSEKYGFSLIQQRSPILPNFTKKFGEYLNTVAAQFDLVIVLDSGDLGVHQGEPIEVFTPLNKSIESLSIEDTSPAPSIIKYLENPKVIKIYAYEGDNFNDAKILAGKVIQDLQQPIPHWITPVSWKGVYGDKPTPILMEEGIYG